MVSIPGSGAAQALPSPPARPEVCPAGRIEETVFVREPVFDPEALRDSSLQSFFLLANRLHRNTSPSFLRRELLVGEGDCWDEERALDSERILRGYRFIARADISTEPAGDGIRMTVRTRDEWTTRPRIRMRVEGGRPRLLGLSFGEENLAGRGILLGAFYREDREERDVGLTFETPQTFGTRLDSSIRVGRTRVGEFLEQGFILPFTGESGRLAARQGYRRRDSFFPYRTGIRAGDDEILLPLLEESFEIAGAFRLGMPGNLTLLGFGLQRERVGFPGYPEAIELVRDGRYDEGTTAPGALVDQISGQVRPRSATRLNFVLGQRNVTFVRREGLDALRGVQDVPVGTDFEITLARSLGPFQGGRSGAPDDLAVRAGLFAGMAPGPAVLISDLRLEGRRVWEDSSGERGWRDLLAEFDLYGYLQPRGWPGHTLFARISGAGGWSMDTPFQLTLGGEDGLRGYADGTIPLGRRLLLSIEDRIQVPSPLPGWTDFGLTLFGDLGSGRSGAVPFGIDSGVRGTVGAGIRVGIPPGTGGVFRFDLAVPFGGGSEGPIFRVSMTEALGLLAGRTDPQMARSRRSSIPMDFPGVGR